MDMNAEALRKFAPGAKPGYVAAIVDGWSWAEKRGLNTPLRACHFLAQISVESKGITDVEEDLSYSARRLVAVWPKRFPTLADAAAYARSPEALANKVYGGRMGNTQPNDGWKYRGRGLKQITGKDNYREIGRKIGVDLLAHPDALLEPRLAFESAVVFFCRPDILAAADRNDIRRVTRLINGGYNGLADRRAAFRQAEHVFGDGTFSEIGAKGPLASNIGRASLVAGGAVGIDTIIDAMDQARDVVAGTRDLSDLLGIPFITVALGIVAIGALGYIVKDRIFIAKNEGL